MVGAVGLPAAAAGRRPELPLLWLGVGRISQRQRGRDMTVRRDVAGLGPLRLVEMFQWDARPYGASQVLTWHSGRTAKADPLDAPITWQGVVYEPYPVEATDFELN